MVSRFIGHQNYPPQSGSELTYELVWNRSSNTYTLIASIDEGNWTGTDLVIPEEVTLDFDEDGEEETYQVTAIGQLGHSDDSFSSVTFPSTISSLSGSSSAPIFDGCTIDNVTFSSNISLSAEVFKDCDISAIDFGGGEVTLNNSAFDGCTLPTIDFTSSGSGYVGNASEVVISGEAFKSCTITEFNLNERIESITGGFSSDTQITTFNIADGFSSPSNRTPYSDITGTIGTLNLPGNMDELTGSTPIATFGNWAGVTINTVNVPDGTTTVQGVQLNQAEIKEVNLPDECTQIGNTTEASAEELAVFNECTFTDRFDMNKVTTAGYYAFYKSEFQKNVGFTIETVKKHAFEECKFVEGVLITTLEGEIEEAAFKKVTFKEQVEIQDVSIIGEEAFRECYFQKGCYFDGDLTTIGGSAFYGATFSNPSLDYPKSLTSIGEDAFNSSNVTSVIFPSDGNLTYIGSGAYDQCQSLTEVFIPKTVTYIGLHAFCDYIDKDEDGRNGGSTFYKIEVDAANTRYLADESTKWVLYEINSSRQPVRLMRVPNQVTGLDLTSYTQLKSIDHWACHYCVNLKSSNDIKLPNTIETIGHNAFEHCINLKDFVYPTGTKTVGYEAFQDCHRLESTKIPEGVEEIDFSTYQRCYSLTGTGSQGENLLPSTLKYIRETAFEDCQSLPNIVYPDGLLEINDKAFRYCYNLASPTFPSSLEEIGAYAFSHCKSETFTTISIPEKVNIINKNTFENCYYLDDLTFTGCITRICTEAFQKCVRLPEVIYPSCLVSIDDRAFQHCYKLASITFTPYDGASSYYLTSIGKQAFRYSALPSVVVPNSIRAINEETFSHCKNLTSITLPDNLEIIHKRAFEYTALPNIDLKNVLYIGELAFQHCNAFTKLVIPTTIKGIAGGAFRNCNNLTKVFMHNIPTPPTKEWVRGWSDWSNEYTAYENVVHNGASSSDYPNYNKDYKLNNTAEYTGSISYTSPYENNVFDCFNPDLSVYVMIDDVDNYRSAPGFARANAFEMGVGKVTQYLYDGKWYDDYYAAVAASGWSEWSFSTREVDGGDVEYKTYYNRNVIAPVIKHQLEWTSFSYYNAVTFEGGIKACDDNGDVITAGGGNIMGKLVVSCDKEALTTTVKDAGAVKGEEYWYGTQTSYGQHETENIEGVLIKGAVSDNLRYPIPLAHTYEGTLVSIGGENYESGDLTSSFGGMSTMAKAKPSDDYNQKGKSAIDNAKLGYMNDYVNTPYAEGRVTSSMIGTSQPHRGYAEMPEDDEAQFRWPYYSMETYSHPFRSEPEKTSLMNGVVHSATIYPPAGYVDFLLRDGRFYLMTQNGSFPQFRGYLRIPGSRDEFIKATSGGAKPFMIVDLNGDGSVTGLQQTPIGDVQDEVWYNMQGVRLKERPAVPGMYILNGKKVIVKNNNQ